jgi:hypothetical protein
MNTSIWALGLVLICFSIAFWLYKRNKSKAPKPPAEPGYYTRMALYQEAEALSYQEFNTLHEYDLLYAKIEAYLKISKDYHYRQMIRYSLKRVNRKRRNRHYQILPYAYPFQVACAYKTLGIGKDCTDLELETAITKIRQQCCAETLKQRNAPEDVMAEAAKRLESGEAAYMLLKNLPA